MFESLDPSPVALVVPVGNYRCDGTDLRQLERPRLPHYVPDVIPPPSLLVFRPSRDTRSKYILRFFLLLHGLAFPLSVYLSVFPSRFSAAWSR